VCPVISDTGEILRGGYVSMSDERFWTEVISSHILSFVIDFGVIAVVTLNGPVGFSFNQVD
jgi:hypothetical protein